MQAPNTPPVRRFKHEISLWGSSEPRPEFFWRDDDLSKTVPSLERFLRLSDRYNVPVAFAAIPTLLTSGAAQAVRGSRHGRIAVHGFTHTNHAAPGLPSSEYPEGRASADVLGELRDGQALVREHARDRFLNLFVPPWGRFDRSFDGLLARAGVIGFSASTNSGRYSVPIQYDCQLVTEHGGTALDFDQIVDRVTRQLQLRRTGAWPRRLPIGIMTHHRTFNPELEARLEALLGLLTAAGCRFADFSSIDLAMADAPKPVKRTSQLGQPQRATEEFGRGARWAETLLQRTLPRADEGFVGLRETLTEIGTISPISVLRYVHLSEAVAGLPDGSRALSAGCGKALAEVATAIARPELAWLGIDVDSQRYRHAGNIASNADVTNIGFAQADLDFPEAWDFGKFDAIVMSEVAIYLRDPAATIKALRKHLKPGGTLTWVEPFVDGDEAAVEKLRKHTQSGHGGFTLEQMTSYVAGMQVLQGSNCYWSSVDRLLKQLWEQMSETKDWRLLDLLFALARLDLSDGRATSRREASAVKVVAREPTSP